MTNDAKFLAEVKRRVAMALKFSSYGNAAEVLREDIPRLIAMIAARDDKLRVDMFFILSGGGLR